MRVVGGASAVSGIEMTGLGGLATSISTTLTVGRIPTANVGVVPDAIRDIMPSASGDRIERFKVKAGARSMPIFTGYSTGPFGLMADHSLEFGAGYVHPAKKLNSGSMWVPGLHPLSADSHGYIVAWGAGRSSTEGLPTILQNLSFDVRGSVGEQIKKAVIAILGTTSIVKQAAFISANMNYESVRARAEQISSEVQKIKVLGSDILNPAFTIKEVEATDGLTRHIRSILGSGMNTKTSAWNTISAAAASIGMTMTCGPDGSTWIIPNFSGCKPVQGSYFETDMISFARVQSVFEYNVSGVILTTNDPGTSVGDRSKATVSVIPGGEFVGGSDGGTIFAEFPGWMSGFGAFTKDHMESKNAAKTKEAVSRYAQAIFCQYRNEARGFSFGTRLCPGILPGTTCAVRVLSHIVPLSGKPLPFRGMFYGYCNSVTHDVDIESGKAISNITLTNVFAEDEFDQMVDHPPLFQSGCKPYGIDYV